PGFKKGKSYPAVLEIHGGPHAQYGEAFFHEFQVLANAGYIVVYSNPRGSKGYGQEHTAAIHGSWGGKDWEDIRAVTDSMLANPSINSKRMGVMGGSYGGYMTLWAIGHTNDFAGAITDRCVSNLVSMGGNSDFVDVPDQYFPGAFWDCPDETWHSSPIRTMGNVETPTLIIHSEGDLRCNVEQADQVFAALQVRKIPCAFVRYPRETSHGMSRNGPPDMRLHRLHQILDWWKTYLHRSRR
ncbi:MAG: prolyl oligopeptidase family serine peptidase, partial [Phycisphaerales bacterium]|nr:prolyl oligopeptidase family serine peptidase [Phycisphaerales bacterium]